MGHYLPVKTDPSSPLLEASFKFFKFYFKTEQKSPFKPTNIEIQQI